MVNQTRVRRALIIGPSFFGYERDIADALVRRGLETSFLDDRDSQAPSYRALLRVARRVGLTLRSRVHQEFISSSDAVGLDLVLFLKCEHLSRAFVAELRRLNPAARFVFYAFDPISKSAPWVADEDCLFDIKFSFDPSDVERLTTLCYLPLFYGPDFTDEVEWEARDYDVSFVGTLHSGRYRFVEPVVREFDASFAFFYSPARWDYALRRLGKDYRGVHRSAVAFTPLSKREVADICARSRVVIDLPRPEQAGLTMRTFEALGAGGGVVTVNPHVFALLPPALHKRVRLVSVDDPEGAVTAVRELLDLPPGPRDMEVRKFSLDEWCESITGGQPIE